jgi:predicted unusual protein kinase regulating ubiquinone biosynthesis (AarF/ABC1/UbiB family)
MAECPLSHFSHTLCQGPEGDKFSIPGPSGFQGFAKHGATPSTQCVLRQKTALISLQAIPFQWSGGTAPLARRLRRALVLTFPHLVNSQPAVNTISTPLDRHKAITLLFLKHNPLRAKSPDEESARILARDVEHLGATFTKAARLFSVRADLLPQPLITALADLKAPGFSETEPAAESLETIRQIIEDELGKKVARAFASFNPEPVRFSNAGQIHRAVLHDGREVSVRVQSPRLRQNIVKDLDSLAEIAAFIDHPSGRVQSHRFSRIVDRLRVTLIRELDYRREAAALVEMRENLEGYPNIVIPKVVQEFSSARVLTTEFTGGSEIWEIPSRRENGGHELASQVFASYLDQMLNLGHVHLEPNLENLLITAENNVVITEANGTTHISASGRTLLSYLLHGITSQDAVSTSEAALRLGHHGGNQVDRSAFLAEIRSALQQPALSGRLLAVARASAAAGFPFGLEIVGIADLFDRLGVIAKALSPQFDSEKFLQQHLRQRRNEAEEQTVRFQEPSAA